MAQLKVMKVLILEDDPVLSNEIKEFLDAKGMECDTALMARFFKAVRSKPYDILYWISMPKINGLGSVSPNKRNRKANTHYDDHGVWPDRW